MARRDAEIDPRGELGDREPTILLQLSKNLAVNGVDEQDLTYSYAISWKIRNHLLDVPP
jgi:hypothetical protein